MLSELINYVQYHVHWNPSYEVTLSLLQQKFGLLREVASHQEWKSVYSSFDLHCRVAFLEGWPLVKVNSQKGFHCSCTYLHQW